MADSDWYGAVNAIWQSKTRKTQEHPVKIVPDIQRIHQYCTKIWLQEKTHFIPITYLMPFKISKRNSSRFKTFLRP